MKREFDHGEGEIAVTTDTVMKAIDEYVRQSPAGLEHFTTLEISRHMGVDEYPVRTSFSWLVRFKQIESVPGVRSERYTGTQHEKYSATVYRKKPQASPVDYAALMGVFCRG